ncbi:MAG: hypothetical protein NT162_00945, partial [Candidatus Woesebacteria bacterium]|nr:hypothetical protein [Candidatus Woesebacteria bacterium]
MHEKEHLMLEGMLMDRSFNDAYNTPPIGPFHYNGERSLLHNYERVYARLSRSVGIDEIENLSKYPDLKESGFAFLDDLEVSCQKSQALKDPQILKDFLRDYKTPIEKIKNGELGQEFLIFAFVLENIVKPVLDSPAYEKDFKINRNAFV